MRTHARGRAKVSVAGSAISRDATCGSYSLRTGVPRTLRFRPAYTKLGAARSRNRRCCSGCRANRRLEADACAEPHLASGIRKSDCFLIILVERIVERDEQSCAIVQIARYGEIDTLVSVELHRSGRYGAAFALAHVLGMRLQRPGISDLHRKLQPAVCLGPIQQHRFARIELDVADGRVRARGQIRREVRGERALDAVD